MVTDEKRSTPSTQPKPATSPGEKSVPDRRSGGGGGGGGHPKVEPPQPWPRK